MTKKLGQIQVRVSGGVRVIPVRVTGVLLYLKYISLTLLHLKNNLRTQRNDNRKYVPVLRLPQKGSRTKIRKSATPRWLDSSIGRGQRSANHAMQSLVRLPFKPGFFSGFVCNCDDHCRRVTTTATQILFFKVTDIFLEYVYPTWPTAATPK